MDLYSDSLLGLSYLVVTTDIFFYFWNEKQRPKSHLEYGGVPSIWRAKGDSEERLFWQGPVKKCVPNACSWELLVWSGVIWGRSGVILEWRFCRIVVCDQTFCQICRRLNGSFVSNGCKMLGPKSILHITSRDTRHPLHNFWWTYSLLVGGKERLFMRERYHRWLMPKGWSYIVSRILECLSAPYWPRIQKTFRKFFEVAIKLGGNIFPYQN